MDVHKDTTKLPQIVTKTFSIISFARAIQMRGFKHETVHPLNSHLADGSPGRNHSICYYIAFTYFLGVEYNGQFCDN